MARSVIGTLHSHSIVQTTIAATPTKLLGIEEVGVDPQVADMLGYAGGEYRPSFTAVNQIEPICDFTLSDLVNALTLIDHQDGKGISGGTDAFDLFAVKKQQVGTRATGANHFKISSKLCFIYLEEITAEQGQHATARFRVCTVYDGTNEPMLVTTSQALPASIDVLTQFFKLGKWDINAVNVDGITGMTYRTGAVVETNFAGGDHRPTFCDLKTVAPQIQLRTLEVPTYSTYGITGTAGSAVTTGYLYKYLKNSTVQLDATAEHIKFTTQANFARIHMGALRGRNNENLGGEILITPVYDGTNKPMTLNLASAVT